jgi:hypothetical protein
MFIPVVDKEIIQTPKIARSINMYITNLVLGKSVSVRVDYYDTRDTSQLIPIDSAFLTIEGDEYNAWGTDDAYLENLVLQKLGLTPEPTPDI